MRGHNVVLIHADRVLANSPHGADGVPTAPREWTGLDTLRRYCDWLADQVTAVYVLAPASGTAAAPPGTETFGRARILRYGPDRRVRCPKIASRTRIWLINGEHLPLVNWTSASASLRGRAGEVTLFGTATTADADCYSESVLVGEGGQVICFQRDYDDSVHFADVRSEVPAFLATSGASAPAVIRHVLIRGWSLASIGALTRRFAVSWAANSCQLHEGYEARWDFLGSPASTVELDMGPAAILPGSAATTAAGRDPDAPVATRTYRAAKRGLDVLAALTVLVLMAPVMLVVCVLIKLTSPGPLFFAHRRQGLNGKEFNCLKFRSMRADAEEMQAALRAQNEVDGPQFKIAKDPRLSPIGGFLRESNLDELPQLFNVLLGQMSLVGPRPSPDDENQFCPAWRRTRLSVKPGITGLWQVLRCRKHPATDFQQWIYYDVAYARHRSFWLDLQIIFYTPVAMFATKYVRRFAARLERRGICSPVTTLTTANGFHE